MQLDQARIAIRERTWLDNLDLALQVICANAKGVFLASLCGVLPAMLANVALLRLMFDLEFSDDEAAGAFVMAIALVMLEAPLATAPLTLYLGQALFERQADPRRVLRDFFRCLPQLTLLQFVARGGLFVMFATAIIPYGVWPYLSEVILLERNPLWTHSGRMSTWKRSNQLHRAHTGDYLIRACLSAGLALALILALTVAQSMLMDWLFGFSGGWFSELIATQAVLWVVVVYFTVARFLSYLDQRIRVEGWEVELLLRAQRERLLRPLG